MKAPYFYLFFINVMANINLFVPYFLIQRRFEGAPLAILITVPLSLLVFTFFSVGMSRFPNHSIFDILSKKFSARLSAFFTIVLGTQWFVAGLITLLGVTLGVRQFFMPQSSNLEAVFLFLLFTLVSVTLPTKKMLTLVKVLLLMTVPFLGMILFKALFSSTISWLSIAEVATHIGEMPSIWTVAIATYVFSGFSNMVLFNRYYSSTIKFYAPLLVGVTGLSAMLFLFFIPIGFQGADGVGDFAFPWLATTDSMVMRFGVVERVFYVYLFLFTLIALTSIALHWHVALELIKQSVPKKATSPVTLTVFIVVTLILLYSLNKGEIQMFAKAWLGGRFFIEVLLVGTIFILSRREKT